MPLAHPDLVDAVRQVVDLGRNVASDVFLIRNIARDEDEHAAGGQSPLEEATLEQGNAAVDGCMVTLRDAFLARAGSTDAEWATDAVGDLVALAKAFRRVPWTAEQRERLEEQERERQLRFDAVQRGEPPPKGDVMSDVLRHKEALPEFAAACWARAVDDTIVWLLTGRPIGVGLWDEIVQRAALVRLATSALMSSAGGEAGEMVERAAASRHETAEFHRVCRRWIGDRGID